MQREMTYAQLKTVIERLFLLPPERRARVLDHLMKQHSEFERREKPPPNWPSSVSPGCTFHQN